MKKFEGLIMTIGREKVRLKSAHFFQRTYSSLLFGVYLFLSLGFALQLPQNILINNFF